MFGFSFSKILVIVAVIAAVWFTLKYLSRKVDARLAERDDKPAAKMRRGANGRANAGDARAVEDMVRCRVCGAYQARNAGPCERADCPQR